MREYRYFLWKEVDPPLFLRPHAAGTRYPLDGEAMKKAAGFIPGERDFSTFRAAGCSANHPIRRVSLGSRLSDATRAEWSGEAGRPLALAARSHRRHARTGAQHHFVSLTVMTARTVVNMFA